MRFTAEVEPRSRADRNGGIERAQIEFPNLLVTHIKLKEAYVVLRSIDNDDALAATNVNYHHGFFGFVLVENRLQVSFTG